MDENQRKGMMMSPASLTLGIISIITSLFWYMAIPTGIIAIVLGTKAAKNTNNQAGKSGVVTGIVGLSICGFCYISGILLIITGNM